MVVDFVTTGRLLGSVGGGASGSKVHCWAVDFVGTSSLSSPKGEGEGEGGLTELRCDALAEDAPEAFFLDFFGFSSSSRSSSTTKSSISAVVLSATELDFAGLDIKYRELDKMTVHV